MKANGDGSTLNSAVQNFADEAAMRDAPPPPAVAIAQGTTEWHAQRAGLPTASRFNDVMAVGKRDGKPLKSRTTYMLQLVAERIAGPQEGPQTAAMRRGIELEPKVLRLYTARTGHEVVPAPFVQHESGIYGASPDGLIGDSGLVEAKTSEPHIYIADIMDVHNDIPERFRWQMIGQCLVTGREWCELAQYSEPLQSLHVARLTPSAEELEQLHAALVSFAADVDEAEEKARELLADLDTGHTEPHYIHPQAEAQIEEAEIAATLDGAETTAAAESRTQAESAAAAGPCRECGPLMMCKRCTAEGMKASAEMRVKEEAARDREIARNDKAWKELSHGQTRLADSLLDLEARKAVAAGNCKRRTQSAIGIAHSITQTERAQTVYLAYENGCTCPDAQAKRAPKCKHQLAIIMRHNIRTRMQPKETAHVD